MKLVVNRCFGGFGLSDKAIEMVMNRKGLNCYRYIQTKFTFKDGVNEYSRCEITDDSMFTHYSTEDLGETVNHIPSESYWYYGNLERNDVDLIAVVEELGEKANGDCSRLEVVEIPDGIDYTIYKYDGIESIHEAHKIW